MTGRTLSCFGFLQIYRNKRAQQRKFLSIFSRNDCSDKIFVKKFPLLGSFLAINLNKLQTRRCLACQSYMNLTLVCQSKEISNQMEPNGEVSNVEIFFLNMTLNNFLFECLRLRHLVPFDWKFLSIDKWINFSRGRNNPRPFHTACNSDNFTPWKSVCAILSVQKCIYKMSDTCII